MSEEKYFYEGTNIEIKKFDLVYDKEDPDYGIITDEPYTTWNEPQIKGVWCPSQEEVLDIFEEHGKDIVNSTGSIMPQDIKHLRFIKRMVHNTWKERLE